MPRGRDPRLGDVVDGIVVLGGEAAAPIVEAAWDPEATPIEDPTALLLPHIPFDADTATELLLRAAGSLRAATERGSGMVRWMKPLADRLAQRGTDLRVPVYIVPIVTESVTLDGERTERAWSYARALAIPGLPLWALSDGRSLVLAGDALDETKAGILVVPGDTGPSDILALPGLGHSWTRSTKTPGSFEVAFDRVALQGDPYPTRIFLLFANGRPEPAATLVIGR